MQSLPIIPSKNSKSWSNSWGFPGVWPPSSPSINHQVYQSENIYQSVPTTLTPFWLEKSYHIIVFPQEFWKKQSFTTLLNWSGSSKKELATETPVHWEIQRSMSTEFCSAMKMNSLKWCPPCPTAGSLNRLDTKCLMIFHIKS